VVFEISKDGRVLEYAQGGQGVEVDPSTLTSSEHFCDYQY
jgi:hypothetical protein